MDEHEHTDLGVSTKELYGEGVLAQTSSLPHEEPKKVYPSFRYEGPEELDLPQSGKMEIHFVKRSETSKVKSDGSHWYECCIEVRCFGDVEGDEEESEAPGNDAEKALDTIARALGKEKDEAY